MHMGKRAIALLIFNPSFCLPADAIAEPGDEPEVIRAKYFIRDEFLVSNSILVCLLLHGEHI